MGIIVRRFLACELARSPVLARLVSFTQIGELARRLGVFWACSPHKLNEVKDAPKTLSCHALQTLNQKSSRVHKLTLLL